MPASLGRSRTFEQFARSGALSGVLLLISAALALGWANSPWHEGYFSLWERQLDLRFQDTALSLSLHQWINDGLMAAFFLLVGLEIKRELLVGELSSPRQAALPIVAALGGMLVPALLYLLLTPPGEARAGWAMPMATDIAFALGILSLLGSRIPVGLKVFLTALAVADDLGAVLVIALFYSGAIHLAPLLLALFFLLLLAGLNRLGVRSLAPYLVIGVALWLSLHESGLHATLAGIGLAFAIPSRTRINAEQFSQRARGLLDEFDQAETGDLLVLTSQGQQEALAALEGAAEGVQAPLLRLEHALQPVVQYGIMPLFALANAGVRLAGPQGDLFTPITLGVMAGLVIGKPLGITAAAWLAVRLGWSSLPTGASWRLLHGTAWLGGIGFTVSLFVASLAFTGPSLSAAKVGILAASLIAGTVGTLVLRK